MPEKALEGAPEERVMIFIDGSNLYHVLAQNCGRYDLVFEKFTAKLGNGRSVLRTYYYNIRQDRTYNPQASAEQEKFLTALFDTPYFEVRLGVHRRQGETMVEKGVDVMMATDIVVGAFRDVFDTAIVVSGDGDFYPAMQAAKDLGKHIEVVAFDSNLSPEARRVADTTILLKKSYFTGMWTRQRRTSTDTATTTKKTPAKKSTTRTKSSRSSAKQDKPEKPEKKEAVAAATSTSSKSNGTDSTAGATGKDDKPTDNRRRRMVRSADGRNGASTAAPAPASESSMDEDALVDKEDQQEENGRPTRRRRASVRNRSSAGSDASSETKELPEDHVTSPSESDSSDEPSGSSGGGGSWFKRRIARSNGPSDKKS